MKNPMLIYLIYVEGWTERAFVLDVLNPYLEGRKGISLQPVVARTKRTRSGMAFKGGIVSYGQVRKDIIGLLKSTNVALVTTMIDFYGLPSNFPGMNNLPSGNPYQQVYHLEQAFQNNINHPRFLPYLSLHEFEALLFADIKIIDQVVQSVPPNNLQQLQNAVAGMPPELINHPSALIENYIPGYRKALHGPQIAELIGLDTIRQKCPHFDEWITKLERMLEDP